MRPTRGEAGVSSAGRRSWRLATRVTAATLSLAVPLGLAACGTGSADDGPDTQTLTVYAAASLTAPFEQIGQEFEAAHEGARVEFSFGGSADLVTQIQEGAPADVFAAADTATMERLVADDLADGTPRDFASNTLEIATPPGNPEGVRDFADLADPGVQLVTCAPEVPCGAATRTMAERLGVRLDPVSEEPSVTDVLAKVTAAEADAGVVYVTDVVAAGDAVTGVRFPESGEVVNTYPIAPVAGGAEPALAAEFVSFVLSGRGQRVLRAAGFAPAP